MKASLKFREEQKPLFKAKIPLNILGFPFQSSLLAGDSKELSLGLGTFFDSGPSFRLSYRPNDAFNPFSLLVKTGIGRLGSPCDAPMTMTAEFNFLSSSSSASSNPRFFLHFKPNFGDFSIKKLHSSSMNSLKRIDNVNVPEMKMNDLEVIEKEDGDYFSVTDTGSLPLKSSFESAVSGMELGAKTALPIRNGAVLKLRWGMRFPEGFQALLKKNPTAKMSPHGIPLLVLNKIGIEHVEKKKDTKVVGSNEMVGPGSGMGGAELAETCFSVKKQLETLRSENAQLGKALDDLKVEFGSKGVTKINEGDYVGISEVSKV